MQCQGNIYKDKCLWADFRNVLSHKRTMMFILLHFNGICCHLEAANDSDNQIMQKMVLTITSAQSEHILPISFFSSGEFCRLSLALRHNFSLTPSTGEFSSWCRTLSRYTHLSQQMKQRFWVCTQHPRFPLSFQTLRTRERLGGEKARLRSLRRRTVW